MTNDDRFTLTLHATDEIEARLAQFEQDRSFGPVEFVNYASSKSDESYGAVITELARIDLEYRFDAGEELDATRYIEMYPDVFADSLNREHIAFEEYRLRRRRGQDLTAAAIAAKYEVEATHWQHVEIEYRKSNKHVKAEFPTVHYPKVGESIAGYPLIQRLGEGKFSRVFLARQPDLVSRLVVVKVTPFSTDESDQLAQLQHTNIIPIYSIHRERDLTCICMPFLGSTTLADLCHSSSRWASLHGPAEELVSTIASRSRSTIRQLTASNEGDATQSNSTVSKHQSSGQILEGSSAKTRSNRQIVPDMSQLAQLGYVDALLALVVGAVEGLSHAHERGIVHRDLKPANILVTDDGRAVLLDFNLAVSTSERETRLVGGTLPYMSPQQLDAIKSSSPADPRDDVFSIGVILYELLSGQLPFETAMPSEAHDLAALSNERRQLPASLCIANKRISTGVESIVFRCLAAERENRYQNAGELLEDLGLHRRHLPLRHAPNVSVKERLTKWVARHPRLTSGTTVGAVAAIALLMSSLLIWKRDNYIERLGVQAKLQRFEDSLPEVVLSLSTPGREPEILQRGLGLSIQLLKHWDADSSSLAKNTEVARLDTASQQSLAKDLANISYLMAAAEADVALQTITSENISRGELAMKWNRLAIELDSSIEPLALFQQHRIESRLTGISIDHSTARQNDLVHHPQWHALLAAESGDSNALREVSLVQLQERPTDLIAWFNLSTAHWRAGELNDAVAGFNVCDRLRPGWFVTVFNRGLCNLERDQAGDAVEDFAACLKLQPTSLAARFNLAVALRRIGKFASSIEELDTVVASGKATTRMMLMRSQVHDAIGNHKQATLDREAAMRITPRDANDWVSRGVSQLAEFPEKAIEDFESARRIDPGNSSALQNAAHVLAERLQRPEEAIECLDQLAELRSQDASAVAARGIVFARMGNVEPALRDAKAAETRTPSAMVELQIAGIYALVADHGTDSADVSNDAIRELALAWVARALRSDASLASVAANDSDLASLRDNAQFNRLILSGKLLDAASR